MVFFDKTEDTFESIFAHVGTVVMPATSCPIDGCANATKDVDAIAAATKLNIHPLVHQRGGVTAAHNPKQFTEEQWETFLKR